MAGSENQAEAIPSETSDSFLGTFARAALNHAAICLECPANATPTFIRISR